MLTAQTQDFWQLSWLGVTARQWTTALVIIAVTFIGLTFIRWVLLRQLGRVASRTKTRIDDFAAEIVGRTRVFFILFVGLYAGARTLPLDPGIAYGLRILGVLVLTLQVAAWGNAVIAAYLRRQVKRRISRDAASATTMTAVGYFIRFVFYVVLLVLALDNLGIEVRTLVATLGIGGIAIALALQKVLGDLFGSLSIVLDKPFILGDSIMVDELSGTVEHIGLKTTRLRSLSGEQLVFSNSDLLEARIRNFQRLRERRVSLTLRVPYETPREHLSAIPAMLESAVRSQEHARFDRAHLSQLAVTAIEFELVYIATTSDYNMHMDMKQAIYLDIHRQFEESRIGFAQTPPPAAVAAAAAAAVPYRIPPV